MSLTPYKFYGDDFFLFPEEFEVEAVAGMRVKAHFGGVPYHGRPDCNRFYSGSFPSFFPFTEHACPQK
jgi:hypothetical protein